MSYIRYLRVVLSCFVFLVGTFSALLHCWFPQIILMDTLINFWLLAHSCWMEFGPFKAFYWQQLTEIWGKHYSDAIMGAMASQITGVSIVYSTVYSGAGQRKHQSSASLAFKGNSPGNSPHKGPITRKMFPFDNVIMWTSSHLVSFFYVGCKYPTMPDLQRRFHKTTIDVRTWMNNYIPLFYVDKSLMRVLISMVL